MLGVGGGDDVALRLCITNRCNSKCRYYAQLKWPKDVQRMETEPLWYYEYLEPFYKRIYAGERAQVVYSKILDNIRNYISLLEEKSVVLCAFFFYGHQ